ncbi:hypothetical protein LIA77_05785 [Sarocladium implicatum]|nr:hypothetical protein LIA77_05785 [Sarocladium implicatum]
MPKVRPAVTGRVQVGLTGGSDGRAQSCQSCQTRFWNPDGHASSRLTGSRDINRRNTSCFDYKGRKSVLAWVGTSRVESSQVKVLAEECFKGLVMIS